MTVPYLDSALQARQHRRWRVPPGRMPVRKEKDDILFTSGQQSRSASRRPTTVTYRTLQRKLDNAMRGTATKQVNVLVFFSKVGDYGRTLMWRGRYIREDEGEREEPRRNFHTDNSYYQESFPRLAAPSAYLDGRGTDGVRVEFTPLRQRLGYVANLRNTQGRCKDGGYKRVSRQYPVV